MRFFRFLQNNTLAIHYLTILIVIVGIMSLFQLRREARPNVNFNRVAVSVAYPGASPSDIEELIIDPIEEKISEVDGVDEYRSVSFVGAGSISIKIDQEYPEPDDVIDELRRKIGEVRGLPAEVEDPSVTEIKAENIPVLRIALYGKLDPLRFKLEVEKLKDFLTTFREVQSVDYTGLSDLQLKIQTSPQKLNQYDMTLLEIINNLRSWSKQQPGGLFEGSQFTNALTVGYDYNEIEKLQNFVLRSNDFGKEVKLGEVAEINYGTERTQVNQVFEDKEAVLLTIVKKPFADTVTTVDKLNASLDKYVQGLPKELSYKLYTDESKRVRERLGLVIKNAITGLILVVVILALFLDIRSAIVTSIGIPVAVLGGFAIIYLLGNTLNSLLIIGVIIVLGMLVDDAIVVCENIYSYIEEGLSPKEAAIKGVSEIATPVIATVLTTVFAFFPILFLKDIIGQFFRVIPMAVIALLVVSLFEALIILPIHAEEIMKAKGKNHERKGLFVKLEAIYRKYLGWSLRHRYLVTFLTVFFFLVSGYQGLQLFKRFTLFPAVGLEGMTISLELPPNTSLDKTTKAVQELSSRLKSISDGKFDSLYAQVGQATTGGSNGSRQNSTSLAQITIAFTSDPDFYKVEKKYVKKIKEVSSQYEKETGFITSVSIDRPGPPIGKPIQLEITSRNLSKGEELAQQIKEKLQKMPGVLALQTDLDGNTIKYRFVINNALATSEGVDPSHISRTIFAASTGVMTNELLKDNEKVELLVSVDQQSMADVKNILNLKVRNNNGQAVPIASFVKIKEELGPSSIQRLNGLRTITLFGEVDEKVITGKEANAKIAPFLEKLTKENPSITITAGGGEKDRVNALKATLKLYILAVVLIFMVISLSFQSVIYPFFVLLTIPMGLCGVVWSLLLHDQPLSIMGLIGVVGLSGVVVNVSIILLSFIKSKLEAGIEFKKAIIDAGVTRLRPILITTITTLIGLIPTIYGIGGLDTFIQPLALVLGWGLFVATAMTVLALPAIVSLLPLKQGLSDES